MSGTASHPPEFSRPVDASRLRPGEEDRWEITADAAEREALARRFGLLRLDRLAATVRLRRLAGGLLRLSAELSADVVQACVVTLEPVASQVADSFSLLYGRPQNEASEVVLSGEAELVEPLDGGAIDIGEATAQQLSLALDPYPRAPGVSLDEARDGVGDSPFAALAKLREKD